MARENDPAVAPSAELRSWEVLDRVVEGLAGRFGPGATQLTDIHVSVEVADDSDWHRSRSGVMAYKALWCLEIEETAQTWLLGTGRPQGYPAERYGGDILLAPVATAELRQALREKHGLWHLLDRSTYFRHSPIFGLSNGVLAVNPNYKGFPLPREAELQRLLHRFIGEGPEYVPGIIHMDGRAVTSSCQRYQPGIVPALIEILERGIRAAGA